MITKDEIERQAERLGVHIPNVERDYVFGWLLKSIYENPYLASLLIFKGGNCMRKAYYPETRFSSDLDFSVLTALDPGRFIVEINQACLAAQEGCGVRFETEKNTFVADRMIDSQRQAYKGRVYFKDFYGEEHDLTISVRLDVTEFDRVFLPSTTRDLIHPYTDADVCQIRIPCMALEELLANKLKCLLQRRHSFDLYDLVYATFFEQSIEVDRGLVLRTFLSKTIFERSPGSAKQILLGLPMAFFKGVWNRYIVCPIQSRFDFERVAEGFVDTINSIFGEVAPAGWGPDPFYPAQFRNLILEAGASKRLLRITYDGREREIEPYALAYKRRQDGHACEYFYAWDRTGGSSSGPGIKTFLHQKIQLLNATEQEFEPRYPIELSKAGETAQRQYFGGPFSRGRQPRPATVRSRSGFTSRTRRNGFAMTYTIECLYCQKRFKRSTYSTALNPHKDPNGYACGGRIGYFV